MNELLQNMLARLTGAYNKQPDSVIGRLFQIYALAVGDVEESLRTTALWRDINNARGTTLDRIGRNFGVSRGGANDELYRILIQVKVIAQLSGGDVDTVIRAAGELLGVQDTDLLLEELYPAKITLYVDWELLPQERAELIDQIAAAIKRILAAGVGLRLYLRTYRTFRYSLTISCAGLIRTSSSFAPLVPQRAVTEQTTRAGGAFCHTHITTRRID